MLTAQDTVRHIYEGEDCKQFKGVTMQQCKGRMNWLPPTRAEGEVSTLDNIAHSSNMECFCVALFEDVGSCSLHSPSSHQLSSLNDVLLQAY